MQRLGGRTVSHSLITDVGIDCGVKMWTHTVCFQVLWTGPFGIYLSECAELWPGLNCQTSKPIPHPSAPVQEGTGSDGWQRKWVETSLLQSVCVPLLCCWPTDEHVHWRWQKCVSCPTGAGYCWQHRRTLPPGVAFPFVTSIVPGDFSIHLQCICGQPSIQLTEDHNLGCPRDILHLCWFILKCIRVAFLWTQGS